MAFDDNGVCAPVKTEKTYLSGTAADQPVLPSDLPVVSVAVFLPAGFEDQEVATVLDVLGWASYRADTAQVKVTTCGFASLAKGAFGTQVAVDQLLGGMDPAEFACDHAALVVPGGFHNLGFDQAYCEPVYQLVRAFRALGKPIATFCVGSVLVANAGVLKGGRATTYALSSHHDNMGALRAGGCTPVEEGGFVEWDGILSCSGPEFAQQTAERLLEILLGEQATSRIKALRRGGVPRSGESASKPAR